MANGRDDLRLAVGWVDHLKTARLIRELGDGAGLCLLRLWSYAAVNHPLGILSNPEDVEPAARWQGEPGAFLKALKRIGWMEPDGVTLHDWKEEQPWIVSKPKRSRLARSNARKGWDTRRKRTSSGHHDDGNAESDFRNTPSPTPSPSPTPLPSPCPSPVPDTRAEGQTACVTADRPTGYSLPAGVEPGKPQAPSAGRSLRVQPTPEPRSEDAAEAQGRAAHRLELTLDTSYAEASKRVDVLLGWGMPLDAINDAIGLTPPGPQKPWEWADRTFRRWQDSTAPAEGIA